MPKKTKKRGKRKGRGRSPVSPVRKLGRLTLMTPAGFRVEGLSGKELIRLLKALN